jgi:hypothetical protein
MSKKLILGLSKSVPAYYEGQRTAGSPNHYETADEAERLRRTGKARAINHGSAILIRGPRRPRQPFRESSKQAWKVVGQTAKKKPDGPGYPHYSSV